MVLTKTWNGTSYSIPQSGERGWASLTNFLSAIADGAQSTGKQLIGRRVATTSPVTITAVTDAYVGVNVSGAVAAVTLPAGVAGQVFYISDESGAAATYNITITPNGAQTIGGAATYVLNANNQAIGIVYSGTDWKLFANFTPVAVTPSSTTTFTNKKLTDNSVTFVDNGDATKQLAFECSGITTGTTRTATVPDANFTMVGTATTQTLTNKTLTGNTATNLISGSGTLTLNTSGTVTIPNATDTLVGKATTDVMTNKTLTSPVITAPAISGAATITVAAAITDTSDATKKINFTTSGNTTAVIQTIASAATTARTATIQDATGKLPVQSQADTATTATINALANTQSVTVLTGSTATALNGITAGFLGQQITIVNNASAAITINNNSASASAGNKILLLNGNSITLPASIRATATFTYTTVSATNFWLLTSSGNAGDVMGTILGAAPTAGFIGEQIRSFASGVSITSGGTTTITSITLTAGVWSISATARIPGVALLTRWQACISSENNTYTCIGSGKGDSDLDMFASGITSNPTGSVANVVVNISASTTYYLIGSPTGATVSAAGRLSAIRIA